MKKSIIIIVAILCFGCSDKAKEATKVHLPSFSLVFIDKTQSIDLSNQYIATKYQNEINGLIAQNISGEGDRLEVYYIHENTAKARCLSMTCRSALGDIEGKNATDIQAQKLAFELSINREKAIFQKQVISKLMQQNGSASNTFTDVLSSLTVIAKAAETSQNLKVYYFSDMIESMKGAGKRDFQANPPKDDAEAIAWAKKDAENYKNLVLGSPEITIISPFDPMASSKVNNPHVSTYWKTIFEELGVSMLNEI
jgi:hypothetical protein